MVNSVGKKLQQARIGKQLSVEEAARVTRIRPDKLIDLEEDNYSNFPSMSYAKGFLLLYARYLEIDVRDFAESLHTPNPVSSDDYEYLNAAANHPPPPPSRREYHPAPRRERTILPVIVFAVLIAAIGFAIHLVITFQRLAGGPDDVAGKKDSATPSATPAISTLSPIAAAPTASPASTPAAPPPVLRSSPPALVAATPSSEPPSTAAAASPSAPAPLPTAAPAPSFDPTREVRRAEPVFPSPPAHADASAAAPVTPAQAIAPTPPSTASALPPVGSAPDDVSSVVPVQTPGPLKQLSILPLRKTWVTIRKDVADSAPLFQDWLYPGDPPLKLSGHKFWIQVKDPASVRITQDGQPVPSGAGGAAGAGGQGDIQIE